MPNHPSEVLHATLIVSWLRELLLLFTQGWKCALSSSFSWLLLLVLADVDMLSSSSLSCWLSLLWCALSPFVSLPLLVLAAVVSSPPLLVPAASAVLNRSFLFNFNLYLSDATAGKEWRISWEQVYLRCFPTSRQAAADRLILVCRDLVHRLALGISKKK